MSRLEFPSEKHRKSYDMLIQHWGDMEEIPTDPSRLFCAHNFDNFLEYIENDVSHNEGGVNSTLFFLIDTNDIIGAIHIRHHIDHPNLFEGGGHIGYGIAPKYRKQGYGTKMLSLGLIEAKKLGIKKVLVCCSSNNIGSQKIIVNNGGVFERHTTDGKTNRYWIDIHH